MKVEGARAPVLQLHSWRRQCHQCSRIRILRFFQISKNMTFYVFLK